MAILRSLILAAFYDTHGDTEDTFSTQTPGSPRGMFILAVFQVPKEKGNQIRSLHKQKRCLTSKVITVTAHRCAGGLKNLDLRSGSQRHRHSHLTCPSKHRHGQTFFHGYSEKQPHFHSLITTHMYKHRHTGKRPVIAARCFLW